MSDEHIKRTAKPPVDITQIRGSLDLSAELVINVCVGVIYNAGTQVPVPKPKTIFKMVVDDGGSCAGEGPRIAELCLELAERTPTKGPDAS